jgi:hypothetical protein
MRNRINVYVLERKANLLDLILINICGFLKAVNSYTRKSWVMPLRFRSEAKPTLKKWRRNQELLSEFKLKAVRSDNATELKSTLDE